MGAETNHERNQRHIYCILYIYMSLDKCSNPKWEPVVCCGWRGIFALDTFSPSFCYFFCKMCVLLPNTCLNRWYRLFVMFELLIFLFTPFSRLFAHIKKYAGVFQRCWQLCKIYMEIMRNVKVNICEKKLYRNDLSS